MLCYNNKPTEIISLLHRFSYFSIEYKNNTDFFLLKDNDNNFTYGTVKVRKTLTTNQINSSVIFYQTLLIFAFQISKEHNTYSLKQTHCRLCPLLRSYTYSPFSYVWLNLMDNEYFVNFYSVFLVFFENWVCREIQVFIVTINTIYKVLLNNSPFSRELIFIVISIINIFLFCFLYIEGSKSISFEQSQNSTKNEITIPSHTTH